MANDDYLQTDRKLMHEEDDRLVEATLVKYLAERFVDDPAKIAELKASLRDAIDEAYRLSQAIVAHHGHSVEKQRRMNELFKQYERVGCAGQGAPVTVAGCAYQQRLTVERDPSAVDQPSVVFSAASLCRSTRFPSSPSRS